MTACINPCDSTVRPSDHLTFDGEFIRARDNSVLGVATIKKYHLDRDELDHKRLKQLQVFDRTLIDILEKRISDGGRPLSDGELELLRRFRQPDHPFSLMFSVTLEARCL